MSRTNFEHAADPLEGGPGLPTSDCIRVALFSADPALTESLQRAINPGDRFSLETTGIDSRGMRSWLLRHPLDLAIVDLEPPINESLSAMSLIANLQPNVQVMALMSRHSLDAATVAVQAGAQSCLLKETSGANDVIAALTGLVSGSSTISPRIARVLINRLRQLH